MADIVRLDLFLEIGKHLATLLLDLVEFAHHLIHLLELLPHLLDFCVVQLLLFLSQIEQAFLSLLSRSTSLRRADRFRKALFERLPSCHEQLDIATNAVPELGYMRIRRRGSLQRFPVTLDVGSHSFSVQTRRILRPSMTILDAQALALARFFFQRTGCSFQLVARFALQSLDPTKGGFNTANAFAKTIRAATAATLGFLLSPLHHFPSWIRESIHGRARAVRRARSVRARTNVAILAQAAGQTHVFESGLQLAIGKVMTLAFTACKLGFFFRVHARAFMHAKGHKPLEKVRTQDFLHLWRAVDVLNRDRSRRHQLVDRRKCALGRQNVMIDQIVVSYRFCLAFSAQSKMRRDDRTHRGTRVGWQRWRRAARAAKVRCE